MYLSPSIYEWSFDADERSSGPDTSSLFRSHEIWEHAATHLDHQPTDLHRVDCISSLRRAINHRLKSLTTVYSFNSLPSGLKKKHLLERLQEFGIVRPVMLKELLEVRNLIEHQDADPPNLETCHRFVDIVWYFLKTTDPLVDRPASRIVYEHGDGFSHVHLGVDPGGGWRVEVDGQIDSLDLPRLRGHI